MCNAAPNNSPCKLEDYDAIACLARRTAVALYDLKKEIPILRVFNEPVQCADFVAEDGDGDG